MRDERHEIPPLMLGAATAAVEGVRYDRGIGFLQSGEIASLVLKAAGVPEMAAQIAELEGELAKHQESSFHPDWSLLDATRESLREAQARIAEMEKQLAADALIARLSEDDEQWQQFERTFMERFADEPNIIRECLLATAEVKTEIAWQSINQAQEARTND